MGVGVLAGVEVSTLGVMAIPFGQILPRCLQ
jgi:hypothetical protein